MKTRYCTIDVAGKYAGNELRRERNVQYVTCLSAMRADSACVAQLFFKVLGCLVKEKNK